MAKRRKLFLGLNKGSHDAGLCLIDESKRGPAVELLLKERWTRVKADGHELSPLAAKLLPRLKAGRIEAAESSFLGRPEPVEDQLHKLAGYYDHLKRSGLGFMSARCNRALEFLPHHYCHAMAAAAVSPFERSLVLVFDGAGSSPKAFGARHPELRAFPAPAGAGRGGIVAESLSVYLQHGPRLRCVRKDWQTLMPVKGDARARLSGGLGMFYETAALFIFNSRRDSGKVMGLAPFGKAAPVSDRVGFYRGLDWRRAFRGRGKRDWERSRNLPYYADIAASVQRHFEESLMSLLSSLRREFPGYRDLILTGGCALNCVANTRAAESGLFRAVYVPPFPGDESIAFGAAQHLRLRRTPRRWAATPWSRQTANFGWSGSEPGASGAARPEKEAARLLARGKVVGWFQGRSESGPRALGYRSILASPLKRGVRDRLNRRVKGREDFRPYGCSVLWEKAHELFEVPKGFDSPFMSFAPKVRPAWRRRLKEVTHADGTSRIQTVRRSQNPLFYDLIREFGRRSGLYAVLNTSLNVMGEPIVETVDDARRFFDLTPIDRMIIGKRLLSRRSGKLPVSSDGRKGRGPAEGFDPAWERWIKIEAG